MTSTNLPEPLKCPDSWKYGGNWQSNYADKHGHDYLAKKCKYGLADWHIMGFICSSGERALTQIKKQNLIIKRLNACTTDPTQIRDYDVDGEMWVKLNNEWEELFEIYNAQKAPVDILDIIDEVKTFVNEGQLHCQLKEELEREQELLQQRQQPSKWDLIDEKHSRVLEGFIYLLSNDLMPGVYKIGFTVGNPDKRARELSVQYGLPMRFEVVEYWRTKDPYLIEQRIHTKLADYAKAGEFFEMNVEIAIETIEDCLLHYEIPID